MFRYPNKSDKKNKQVKTLTWNAGTLAETYVLLTYYTGQSASNDRIKYLGAILASHHNIIICSALLMNAGSRPVHKLR